MFWFWFIHQIIADAFTAGEILKFSSSALLIGKVELSVPYVFNYFSLHILYYGINKQIKAMSVQR